MTLNKIELVHPIFEMIFIGLSTFSVFSIFEFDLVNASFIELVNPILRIIFIYIFYQILNISKRVEIKNNQLMAGIYINPIGFVKMTNQILIIDIIEIGIYQNSKKYFEIFAKSKDGKIITIKAIPNKFPAEEALEVIKNEISTYKLQNQSQK